MSDISTFTELDLATACFNTEVLPIVKSNARMISRHYSGNEIISKLMDLLISDDLSSYSPVDFNARLLSLNLGTEINKTISASFENSMKYTPSEISSIKKTLANIITLEYINDQQSNFTEDPIGYVRSIKEFNVDNIISISDDVASEMDFGNVDVDNLDTEIQGSSLKSSFNFINKLNPLGGWMDRTLNMISGAPGAGKSLFMMKEACEFLSQGKKVLYAAIGDMNIFHFISRMSAMLLKKPLNATTIGFKYDYPLMLKNFPYMKNLKIQFMLPGKVTCPDFISNLKSKGYFDSYDVFIIDYDTNFASDEDMYSKGESTYNALKELADRPGKYVFVGCQPKQGYWGSEILPLDASSESSRKQQIVDTMVTISHPASPQNVNHIGIINVCKNRVGGLGSSYYFLDKNVRMEEISQSMYAYLKVTTDSVTMPGSGCEATIKTKLNEEVNMDDVNT